VQQLVVSALKTEEADSEFRPLNFQKLRKAQETDKTIMKILEMENTKYELQDFQGQNTCTR
jgi:hypothetical protein